MHRTWPFVDPVTTSTIMPSGESPADHRCADLYHAAKAHYDKHQVAEAIGPVSECIDVLQKAHQTPRGDEVLRAALILRGAVYKQTGRLREAYKDYTAWCTLCPDDYLAFSSRASVSFARNKFASCVKDYKRCLMKRDPHGGSVPPDVVAHYYYNIGVAYRGRGCYAAAAHWFAQAVKTQPDFQLAHQNLKSVKVIRSVRTHDALKRQIGRLRLGDGPDDQNANRLSFLRALVHYCLSHTSIEHFERAVGEHATAAREPGLQPRADGFSFSAPYANDSFTREPSESVGRGGGRAAPHSSGEHRLLHEVVMQQCAHCLTVLSGAHIASMADFLRDNRVQAQGSLDITVRQAMNFVCEFAMNYPTLEAFAAAQFSSSDLQHQRELDEDMGVPPEQKARRASQASRLEQSVHAFQAAQAARAAPDPGRFVPQLLGGANPPLLDPAQLAELHESLPGWCQAQDLQLAYSTRVHGCSLNTFYRNAAAIGPNVLLVQDATGVVFGGFSSIAWAPDRLYQGTGETFVFTCRYGELQPFFWSRANDYFFLARRDGIHFGGGGVGPSTWTGSSRRGRRGTAAPSAARVWRRTRTLTLFVWSAGVCPSGAPRIEWSCRRSPF